ncbi:MAG: ribosomal protein S18-alanine N-acetyltransferase [Bacillota bacterium]
MNKGEVLVRTMRADDTAVLAKLERECFDLPWSRNAFESELKNKCAHYIVLENETGIIGYAGMWVVIDEAHITNVAVSPQHRQKGYGRKLMEALMRSAIELGVETMTLEVRESNHIAQALYRDMDFKWCGIRKKYYSNNGEDAVIMWNREISKTMQAQGKIRE